MLFMVSIVVLVQESQVCAHAFAITLIAIRTTEIKTVFQELDVPYSGKFPRGKILQLQYALLLRKYFAGLKYADACTLVVAPIICYNAMCKFLRM